MLKLAAVCLLLFLGAGCSSYVELTLRLQARSEKSDPLITYFDNRTGLRFSDRGRGVKRRVIFLNKQRLLPVVRRMFPSGRAPRRLPDLQAVEMHFLNYGTRTLAVDFRNFQIREKKSGKLYSPLTPRSFYAGVFGGGMSGLPYVWAFEQKDSFAFHVPVPDWFARSRARRTGSRQEYASRRTALWRRLEAEHRPRTRVLPGREVKGIALFPLLAPNRDYVLEYQPTKETAGQGFAFNPFHFQVKLLRGAKPTGANTKRRVFFAFQRDAQRVEQESAEYFRMHEQLREHDRLRRARKDRRK